MLNAQRSGLPVQRSCATINAQSTQARLLEATYAEPVEPPSPLTHHFINMTGGTMEHMMANKTRWNVKSVAPFVLQLPYSKSTWRKNMAGYLSSVASLAVALTSMSFRACRSISSFAIKVLKRLKRKKVTAV